MSISRSQLRREVEYELHHQLMRARHKRQVKIAFWSLMAFMVGVCFLNWMAAYEQVNGIPK